MAEVKEKAVEEKISDLKTESFLKLLSDLNNKENTHEQETK